MVSRVSPGLSRENGKWATQEGENSGKLFHINFCRVFDIQNVPIVHICQFPLENKTEINVKCLNVSQKTFVTINQQ